MTKHMIDSGRRFQEQVAAVMTLLARMQGSLAECAGNGVPASAVAEFTEQQAELVETSSTLLEAYAELQGRVEERSATLASRETALETSRQQLRILTRRLVQVQEDERRALARDLHDTSGQAMTVINIGLAMLAREACSENSLARLEDLRRVATTVGEDLHRLSVNLRPSSLDRYGLVPAVEDLVASWRRQTETGIEFVVEGMEDRLPGDMETALYRIIQEACTNIARYAEASQLSISMRRDSGTVRLQVRDNGRGFDVTEALNRGRLGLLGMRERAEMFGGEFRIESRPQEGTVLEIVLPLEAAAMPDNLDTTAADFPDAGGLAVPGTDPSPVATEALETPSVTTGAAATEAIELARAKALSDALVDIAAGIARYTKASEMLDFVLCGAAEAVGCEMATIMERQCGGWLIRHGYHAPPGLVGRRLSDDEAPTTTQVALTHEMAVVNDLGEVSPEAGRAAADFALASFACIPLLSGDRLLGAANFSYHTIPGVFAPSEVDFLKRLASLVSLALENIRLGQLETQQRQVLEAIFATVPVGLAVLAGSEFEIRLANAAYRSLTPHAEMDPTGRRYLEIWPPNEGFGDGESWLEKVIQTGEALDVAHDARVFPNGTVHHFSFHLRRLFWDSEPAVLVVLKETTEIEESAANTRLEEQRDWLNSLLESIPDEIWFADAKGNITAANPAAIRGIGLEATGDGFQPVPDWTGLEMLDSDGRPRPIEQTPLLRALRGERVDRQEEIVRNLRTGEWRYRQASGEAIRDSSGEVIGAVLVVRDVTEQKQADQEREQMEERLRESTAREARETDLVRSVLFALPDGLIVYGADGQVLRMNELARSMLVYDDESWSRPVGERVTKVVQLSRPDGTQLAREEYPALRALRGEEVRNEDLFLHLPAHPERDFWAVLSACPMLGPSGERLGAVLTMTDVTDLHEVRQSLQAANRVLQTQADELREAKQGLEQRVQERTIELAKLLEEIEGNRAQLKALSRRLVEMQENERTYVADQLYNQAAQVLAAVRLQLWALEKHEGDQAPVEYLAGMKAALDQTILALHDLAAQLRPAALARATLAEVLRDHVSRFTAAQGIAFRFEADGTEDLRVQAEVVTAVFRTIQEAASNVGRHSHASEVALSLHHVDGRLTVTLTDNGIGFSADAPPANGGVGLIAMRERVESVGGRLDIESSPHGTSLRITAPVFSKSEV